MKKYYEFLDGLLRKPIMGRFLALLAIWCSGVGAACIAEGIHVLGDPIIVYPAIVNLAIIGLYPWFGCIYYICFFRDLGDYVFFGGSLFVMFCTCLVFLIRPTMKTCIVACFCVLFLEPIVYRTGIHNLLF